MLYSPNFEIEALAKEEFATSALIEWLSTEPMAVWLWFAQNANWDTCAPVLSWMIEQPNCDRAVVATIFWLSDPLCLAEKLASSEEMPFLWDADEISISILEKWKVNPSKASRYMAQVSESIDLYCVFLKENADNRDPLSIPNWLFGPFDGRMIGKDIEQKIGEDEKIRRILLELGMDFSLPNLPEDPIKRMLALETPEQARERKLIGLLLMAPAIALLGWYLA